MSLDPCRHECLRHIAAADNVKLLLRGSLDVFGVLAKNRLLARAAQNGVSMFVSVYGAATVRER